MKLDARIFLLSFSRCSGGTCGVRGTEEIPIAPTAQRPSFFCMFYNIFGKWLQFGVLVVWERNGDRRLTIAILQ